MEPKRQKEEKNGDDLGPSISNERAEILLNGASSSAEIES